MKSEENDDWQAYNRCRSEMRKIVNERKRKDYQAYINDLQEKDCTNAITQISRMQRLRLRRTKQKQNEWKGL